MNTKFSFNTEIIVDNFCGGGGASTGIEFAIGRPIDYAINHDSAAINMHKKNHPYTTHFLESVWEVDPKKLCTGRQVALAWFSPDCKHFSKAKGGKPREKKIRGLAWVALKWAAAVKPRVIIIENVEEFKDWGPLKKGKPIKSKKGETFDKWKIQLELLGYKVEYKELRACDYGAPTIRKRFFVIARRDKDIIVWPKATHGTEEGLLPYKTAADIIDFSIFCPSIFGRKKELVINTIRRIAKGLEKFVIKAEDPFIISSGNEITTPYLIQYHSEVTSGEVRGQKVSEPILTVDSSNRYGFISPFLVEYYSKGRPISVKEPFHTQTTRHRQALIEIKIANLEEINDIYNWGKVRDLLNTYCEYDIKNDEILILRMADKNYFIADIGMRMLTARELYNAQGFPADYCIDFSVNGKKFTEKEKIAKCGNSVPPPFAEALVRANLPELCGKKIKTMAELETA